MPNGLQAPANHPGLQDAGGGGGGVDPDFDTLAELFAFGLANDPDVDNLLVGEYFNIFLDGETDGIFAYQSDPSNGSDYDSHPLVRLKRHFDASVAPGLVAEYETQYDNLTNNDFAGGVRFDSFVTRDNGTRFPIVQQTHQAVRPTLAAPGYSPTYSSSEPITTATWDLLNRRGSGNASVMSFNSDGGHFRTVILPNSGGPFSYYGTLLDAVGTSGLPQIGSEIIYDAVSVYNLGYESPGQHEIGHASMVFDAENSGSGQYAGHMEWWVRSSLGDPLTLALELYSTQANFAGSVDVAAALVTEGLTVNQNALISGDLQIAPGGLDVFDDSHFSGDVTIDGVCYADDFQSTSPARFSAGIACEDDGTVTGDWDVTGDVSAATFNGAALPAAAPTWTTDTAAGNQQDLATTLSMSGAEQCYRFAFRITQNGTGTPNFTIQPNASSANSGVTMQGKVGTTTAVNNETEFFIGGGNGAGARMHGFGTLSQIGSITHVFYTYVADNGTATHIERYTCTGMYYGGTLTGLRIHATGASSIATGSTLRVEKIN